MENRLLEEALKYRGLGWSVIPVKKDKRPAVPWQQYQEHFATDEEINAWWSYGSTYGIALITGKLSGVVVIDDDRPKHNVKGDFKPAPTVTSKTGSGGFHYLYKYPTHEVKNSAGQIEQYVDVRGEGGYVVLPPSENESGAYEWLVSPFESGLEEYPIKPEFTQSTPEVSTVLGSPAWMQALMGVPEGGRNNALTALAGKLMSKYPASQWGSFVWPIMEMSNNKNNPPLDAKELRGIYESVCSLAIKEAPTEVDLKTVFRPETWEVLSAREFAPIEWLVQDLIPNPALVSVSSKSGIGKTLSMLDIVKHIADGSQFLGKYQCKEGAVLFIDGETGQPEIHRRCKLLGFDDIRNKKNFHHLTTYDLNLKTKEGLEVLREYIIEHNIRVVIIDTLRPFSGCMDENDGAKVREFMHPFMKMRDELEVTFIILDHERKPAMGESKRADQSQVVGSQDKIASVDVALSLKSVDRDTRSLHQTKARRSPRIEEPIYYKIDHHYLTSGIERIKLSWLDQKDVEESKLDEAKELVVTKILEGEEYTSPEFIEVLKKDGVGKTNVEKALKELFEENLIDRYKKDGERGYTYRKLPTS